MRKSSALISILSFLILITAIESAAQSVMIGPRLTGNLNIYNEKGLTGTWNGVGIGIGGTVDVMFTKKIGILVNVTAFDMKNFSNSQTTQGVTTEASASLSYFSLDPMFKAEFSGFYMVGGGSFGIKIGSSAERTQSAAGQQPQVASLNLDTKSIIFNIAAGTGYNFKLSSDMVLGSDFMVYIPITDTFNSPGLSNGILSLKLGASLKFKL